MLILVWVIRCKHCILKEWCPFVALYSNSGLKNQGIFIDTQDELC